MKHLQYILLMTVIVLLAACSQDLAEEQAQEPDAPLRLAGVTRALTDEPAYSDIRFFLTEGTTATEGLFKYAGASAWTTQLKLKSGARTYQLYGYMPDNADFVRSISDWNENGAVLHIQQLPPMTEQDYCIVTGVRQAADENDRTSAVRGAFSFDYDSQRENYINLFLDHLYSHIVFCMKVGEEYDAVRTIKVKRMKLKVADISHYNVDITLTKDVGISSVTQTNITGSETPELTIREEEITLTTSSQTICSGYIIPATMLFDKLSLVIDYDIYDKRGNKVAVRTATNSLKIPLEELQRGEERTLQINIDPSYLYDLSLNDPPIVIIRN
jgi:hypothetical protein